MIEPGRRRELATEPPRDVALTRLLEAPMIPWDSERRGEPMPSALRDRYGGDLVIPLRADRPTVIANFVSTIDGVVAYDAAGLSGGGEISGFFEPDRFAMGLLRALADVVLVGAGTVRAAPDHAWTPAHVHRPSAELYARWRADLGLTAVHPTTVVVSGTGDLPIGHPGLADPAVPVVVVTTAAGVARLRAIGVAPHVHTRTGRDPAHVTAADLIDTTAELGARVVLCEGGPHLLGQFVGAQLVDELFLTVAPQLAGRADVAPRLALLEGSAFQVDTAPWARLRSVHRSGDHLFLRYALARAGRERLMKGSR